MDILVFINIFITFFALKSVAFFLREKMKNTRFAFGCLIGGASSLLILLPPLPSLITILIKLSGFAFTAVVVFGKKKNSLKYIVVYSLVNAVFAGIFLLLYTFSAPLGMVWVNGTPNFNDINGGVLSGSVIVSYFVIRWLRYFIDVKTNSDKLYNLEIVYMGKKYNFNAFADTGAGGVDIITQKPVIIVSAKSLPEPEPEKTRLYVVNTVVGSGYMKLLRADEIVIDGKRIDALVGLCEETLLNEALFNPKILR